MENILKLIKYYAYILIQYMAKALFFTYIYNWFVPVLFPVFPIIDKAEGMAIILIAEFLLSDKADNIYSENTSYGMILGDFAVVRVKNGDFESITDLDIKILLGK